MATYYVKSTAGGAGTGADWTNAFTTLAAAAAVDAAGDTIYVSQSHNETNAAAVTLLWAGTLAAPTKIICANDGATPPTATATTGKLTVTGNNAFRQDGCVYVYGMQFDMGTTFSSPNHNLSNSAASVVQTYEDCALRQLATGNPGIVLSGSNAAPNSILNFINCNLKISSASNAGFMALGGCVVNIIGGGFESGSTAMASVFHNGYGRGASLHLNGVNLEHMGSSANLIQNGGFPQMGRMIIRNCKLPSSWSGGLVSAAITNVGPVAEMHNCDSTDTNYRLWTERYEGNVKSETTIVRTGGASDGTTALSWKMATSANTSYPNIILDSPEIVIWNDSTGSKTATIEILHFAQGAGTSGALRDNEVWLAVVYLGTSGFPLALQIDDCQADVLATAADQTTTTEAWDSLTTAYSAATNYTVGAIIEPTTPNGAIYQLTTDAGTTAAEPTWGTTDGGTTVDATGRTWTRSNRQKLNVTFTTNETGFIHAKVMAAKASKTVYVCPKLTVA